MKFSVGPQWRALFAILAVAFPMAAGATGPAIHFDPPGGLASSLFPDVQLVHFQMDAGSGSVRGGMLSLRLVNTSVFISSPAVLKIEDRNGWTIMSGAAISVPALSPGKSFTPAPIEMKIDASAIAQWRALNEMGAHTAAPCGVDLTAVLTYTGPVEAVRGKSQSFDLFMGDESSNPWQELAPTADTSICDQNFCTSLNAAKRNVYRALGCKVMGYAMFVGDSIMGNRARYDAYGLARSLADGHDSFTPNTQMQIASASKLLTALAAFRAVQGTLSHPAVEFFPPDWSIPGNSVIGSVRVRDFLAHSSGVMDKYARASNGSGTNMPDDDTLKRFFTAPLGNIAAPYACNANIAPGPNPIIADRHVCYSNVNYALMRIVLPRALGYRGSDPSQAYEDMVRQFVFMPVGVFGVDCKPTKGGYAFFYAKATTAKGADFGDLDAYCGDHGWYVSVGDYAKVLVSLNAADHKILRDCALNDMEFNKNGYGEAAPMGFDITSYSPASGTTYRYIQKGGAEGDASGATQTTSVGIFGGSSWCTNRFNAGVAGAGPKSGVAAVLFVNSPVVGGGNATSVMRDALVAATSPR